MVCHQHGQHRKSVCILIQAASLGEGCKEARDKVLPADIRVSVDIGQQIDQELPIHRTRREQTGVQYINAVLRCKLDHQLASLSLVMPDHGLEDDAVFGVGLVEAHDRVQQTLRAGVVCVAVLIAAGCGIGKATQCQCLLHRHHAGADLCELAICQVKQVSLGVFQPIESAVAIQTRVIEGHVHPVENQVHAAGIRVIFLQHALLCDQDAAPLAAVHRVPQNTFQRLAALERIRVKSAIPVIGGQIRRVADPYSLGKSHERQIKLAEDLRVGAYKPHRLIIIQNRALLVQRDKAGQIGITGIPVSPEVDAGAGLCTVVRVQYDQIIAQLAGKVSADHFLVGIALHQPDPNGAVSCGEGVDLWVVGLARADHPAFPFIVQRVIAKDGETAVRRFCVEIQVVALALQAAEILIARPHGKFRRHVSRLGLG